MSVKELMEHYSYSYFGNCNCGGTYTEKFKNGKYVFKWRKNKFQFLIKHGPDVIISWTPLKEAEQKLKELHVAAEAK